MRICDVEEATGLDRATIRFYEKEGYLSPKRQENGYRDYSQEDVDLLLKVKLLRQLGFRLDKISQLQQGSIDFGAALSEQIRYLAERNKADQASMQVCREMSADCVNYRTLNTKHYLTRHQQILTGEETAAKPFREPVQEEPPHPWRRFFARTLDYAMLNCIVRFVLFVVLRIRPIPGDILNILLTVGVGILMIPIEAMLLSKFGATPGKMLMGIRLEDDEEGKYLAFNTALSRSAYVFIAGVGLYLPFVQLITLIYHYCALTGRSARRFKKYNEINEPRPMSWDECIVTTYKDISGKRILALICSVLMLLILSAVTANDSIKPKYRGSELTITQFAANYNAYLKLTDSASMYQLKEDGSRDVPPEDRNTVVVYMNGEETNNIGAYRYLTDNGVLRSVIYENSWDDVFYLLPISDAAVTPAATLLLSQEGCGIRELEEFMQLWENEMDETSGTVVYRNLTVTWEIDPGTGCYTGNNLIISESEEPSCATVYVCITVNPVK